MTGRLVRSAAAVVIGLASFLVPNAMVAQETSPDAANAPEVARALVVAIRAYREGGSIAENGAGIVLGVDDEALFIATALHVVEGRQARTFVVFEDARGDSVQATVAAQADSVSQIDLAILRVPLSSAPDVDRILRFMDRRGDAFDLSLGDRVSPVGCPDGAQGCWTAPSPPDRVLGQAGLVTFQTTFVDPGSSGGALFNEDWEVVGMVVTDQQPRADAIPINQIVLQAERWGVPVSLVPPPVPRSGYGITAGLAILLPSQSLTDRFPSARGGVTLRLNRQFSVVANVLRLSPEDAGSRCRQSDARTPCDAVANGVLGGISYDLRAGRFSAHPFAEVGFADVSGRWDAGGIFVEGVYVPDWRGERTTGLAWGVGATVHAVLFPHVIFEVVGGSWGVPDPFTGVPNLTTDLPRLYYGIGLRVGL